MEYIRQIRKDWHLLKLVIPIEKERVEPFLFDESSDKLVRFLITAEDHRYKYHIGFDIIAIFRALWKLLMENTKEGASTIEQQLVRVITNDYTRSIARKLKEIILAVLLSRKYDKRTIALIYLNIAYYGTKYQSLDSVLAKFNYSKTDNIDYRTCAEIVARLKYPEPSYYNQRRLVQIERRVQHILFLYNVYSKSNMLII